MISLLSLVQWFGVREVVLGIILIPFGDVGATGIEKPYLGYWEAGESNILLEMGVSQYGIEKQVR